MLGCALESFLRLLSERLVMLSLPKKPTSTRPKNSDKVLLSVVDMDWGVRLYRQKEIDAWLEQMKREQPEHPSVV